jgi:two-component system sensor histidine kinase MprB
MSLRLRLALIVATTFAAVVVACVFAAHVSASNQLSAETDRFLTEHAHDPFLEHSPDNDSDTRPPSLGPDVVVQRLNAEGTPVGGTDKLGVTAKDRAVAAGAGAYFRTDNGYRILTFPAPGGGAVQIARTTAASNHVLSTLDTRLLLIAIGGTLLAALAAYFIARRIIRPVEKLTGAAEHVAATQDLAAHIDVERNDELGRLAESFNTMLIALDTSRDQQKRLVMDASHELRTPLTALRTNMEVLQRASNMNDDQRAQLLGEAQLELHELSDLVAELVDLATDARAEEPMQRVDLGELAEQVVTRFRRRTDHQINFAAERAAAVDVRVSACERAISNLVDNACKFSPPEAPVDVCVRGAVVEVNDRGPGIAPEDRPHVFDRFYRATSARAMTGSGLGLSIVQQIAELHDGTVELVPRDGGGTTARFVLPTS